MTDNRRGKLSEWLGNAKLCYIVPATVVLYPVIVSGLLVWWGTSTVKKTAKKHYRRFRARSTRAVEIPRLWKPTPDPGRVIRVASVTESGANSLQLGILRLPPEIRHQIWGLCVANRFIYHPASRAAHSLAPHVGIGQLPLDRKLYSNRVPYPTSLPASIHIRMPPHPLLVKYPGIAPEERFDRFNLLNYHSWCHQDFGVLNTGLEISTMTCTSFIRVSLDDTVVKSAKSRKWTGICLMLTCRKIYREVWPLLYAENTFAFNYLEHFLAFRTTVGTSRLETISYLHLSIIPSHSSCSKRLGGLVDFESWQALWTLVGTEMTALRELDLELHIRDGWQWCGKEEYRTGVKFVKGLENWADNLKTLRGRLDRARLMCNAGRIADQNEIHPRERLFRGTFLKLGQNLAEMQCLITKDGKGGWKDVG